MRKGLQGTRLALLGLACLLVWVGVALAAPGDPQRDFKPADQASARSYLLKKSDLPGKQWVGKAVNFTGANPACVVQHYGLDALTVNGEAGSTFELGGVVDVESDGHVFETAAQSGRAFAIWSQPGLARCLGSAFVASILKGAPKGASARVVRVTRLALGGLPVSASGFRIGISLHSPKGSVPVDLVAVNLRRGRAFGSLSLIGPGQLWTTPVVRLLAGKMAARIAKR